jgi:hypothetical protein
VNCTSPTTKNGEKRQPKTTPARVRKSLEEKLLALGGSKVIWQGYDPQAALIVARGQLFSQRVRTRRGEPHRCHGNAAELWASGIDRYQLVTGYALSGGKWVSHSWVVEGKSLYETTHRFDRYFGVVLPPLLAHKFWFENFYVQQYPDGAPPAEFWENRPGIVSLGRTVAAMPHEEWVRLMRAQSRGHCA